MSIPQSVRRTLAHVGVGLENEASPLLRCNGWRALTANRSISTRGAGLIVPAITYIRHPLHSQVGGV